MTINSYQELVEHVGHSLTAVTYGDENAALECAALECEDCSEVLFEFMNPEYEEVYSWNPEDDEE